MRILMVTSFPIPGEYDGTAMLPIKIVRALKARGVEVALAHLQARRPWRRPARGDFEGIPSYTFAPPSWLPGLRRIARDFPFDIVHAQHYGGATRALLPCRIHGWPMVYEVHSLLGDEVERDRLGRGAVFRLYLAPSRTEVIFSLETWESQLPRLVLLLANPPAQIPPPHRINLLFPRKALVSSPLSD